jgi:hypothetical protein
MLGEIRHRHYRIAAFGVQLHDDTCPIISKPEANLCDASPRRTAQ